MSREESIQKTDLEPILTDEYRRHAFQRALEKITTPDALLRVLGRYIHFNSVFGGGVANLAGEVAVRQDLFRDPDEVVEVIADRSAEVAADVFFAAIDEFDERSTSYRDTHRTLAQATLKAIGRFYGYDVATLNQKVQINQTTRTAIGKVRQGYGVGQALSDQQLFRGLGFHMGSEILADEEFCLLDGYFKTQHPDLVKYLQEHTIEVAGAQHVAYFWIRIHTSVEAIHFDYAAQGANRALHYYAGPEDRAHIKAWILEGFTEFANVQTEFMEGLLDE